MEQNQPLQNQEQPEVKPASFYGKSISVRPELKDNDAWVKEGAVLQDGSSVQSWDWWSRGARTPVDGFGAVVPTLTPFWAGTNGENWKAEKKPLLYRWQDPARPWINGLMRFMEVDGKLYVVTIGPDFIRSQVAGVAEVIVEEGGKMIWTLDSGKGAVGAEVVLTEEGNLKGKCFYSGGQLNGVLEGTPVAIPMTKENNISLDGYAFLAFPDSRFKDAIQNGARSVRIPFGYTGYGFGMDQSLRDYLK